MLGHSFKGHALAMFFLLQNIFIEMKLWGGKKSLRKNLKK